jgi:divalent metal cation (Fe/Co/Zn/Cd) transporter
VSNIFPTFSGADALGGLLISWMVVRAGYGNTRTSLVELADASFDSEIKSKVQRAAEKALGEAFSGEGIEVRDVQGIKAGQNYLVEVELAVPSDCSVGRTRAVEEAVRVRIGEKVRGARRVRVRFVPDDLGDRDFLEEFISPSVSARSSPEPEEDRKNDDDHEHGHEHSPHPNGNGLRHRK